MAATSITLNKVEMFKTVESLLYKYGNAIDNDANYKQVFNTQSDSTNDTLDRRVLADAWETATDAVVGLMRDFSPTVSTDGTTGTKTVTLAMPSRWLGSQSTLQSVAERYVADGMMADYLHVSAPTEAAIYNTRLQQDVIDIKVELYMKGAPQ